MPEDPCYFPGDVLLSSVPPIRLIYTRMCARAPRLTSPLALSSFLHSHRHHRKLQTSSPQGGCPTELRPIRSTENFPAVRLNRRAARAASSCIRRIVARMCAVRARVTAGYTTSEVEAQHPTHGHVSLYTHANIFGILMSPYWWSRAPGNRWGFDPRVLSGVLCNSKPRSIASTCRSGA